MLVVNRRTRCRNRLFGLFTLISIVLILCMLYSLASLSSFKNNCNMIGYRSLDNRRIHIVVVSDKDRLIRYKQHGKTILCYAHRHGYQFSFLDPSQYYTCSSMTNFFFKKHCAVMLYLIQHLDAQWLVVLDGDTFVVNATKSLESFIPTDPNIHVVHYERFWNNEIMAGNYIIRSHSWSLLYLNKWVEFFRKMPNVSFHNSDNGVLHLHFLDMVGKLDNHTDQTCSALYKNSSNEMLYFKYVACTKCALKGQRKFPHIILHRRGHSFCRDIRLPMNKIHQLDLMLHDYKEDLNQFFEEPVNSSSCINVPNWTPKLRQSVLVPDLTTAKILMRDWEEFSSKKFAQTVVFTEIGDCWPDCEPEITGAKLDLYTSVLCNLGKQET